MKPQGIFDPIELTQRVVQRYIDYLQTTFYFKDPRLRKSFQDALQDGYLSKGPYIEATPIYKQGRSAEDVINELLAEPSAEAFIKAINGKRKLYSHQENALVNSIKKKHNIVVTTGTASGKTESFLYPILTHLYKEHKENKLTDGVRALILYPMNALANDQRERLGEISKVLEQDNSGFRFTFGQYIGETPEDKNDSRRYAQEKEKNRLPGEKVFREEMRNDPPHILLTNYSMLEYLLIRPDDSPLFDNGNAQWWKFIVLDEAHQYRGSKAIEMGMLIRRLKQRLREGGCEGKLQCIATSATIAGGENDKPAVATFAESLFGEEFLKDDIIFGIPQSIKEKGDISIAPNDYELLFDAMKEQVIEPIQRIGQKYQLDIKVGDDIPTILGSILKHDKRAIKLRETITQRAYSTTELADLIFNDLSPEHKISSLSYLVYLLINSRDFMTGNALLSARYHLFLRSLEGAFISFKPEVTILIERGDKNEQKKSFEVALCRECGQHYIVGRIKNEKLVEAVRDPSHPDYGAQFFLPLSNIDSDYNPSEDIKSKIVALCVECGISTYCKKDITPPPCDHNNHILLEEQPGAREKEDQIPKCVVCGYQGRDPVREVVHGTDGPHAVVATTLFQYLPEKRRRILTFSDSRQDAAFFAWYLQKTFEDIRNRRLLLQAIKNTKSIGDEGLSLKDIAMSLRNIYSQESIFPPTTSELEILREAWKVIYKEFLTDEHRISLEGTGLIKWTVKLANSNSFPEFLSEQPWSLSEDESQNLSQLLLNTLRIDNAAEIITEENISIRWPDLSLLGSHMAARIGLPKNQRFIRSWDGKTGKRAQFLKKLLRQNGLTKEAAEIEAVHCLQHFWENYKKNDEIYDKNDRLLLHFNDAKRLNPLWWRAKLVDNNDDIHICDTCSTIHTLTIKNICTRVKCNGQLKKIKPSGLAENHYRTLYSSAMPSRFRAEEHTAQIDKEMARSFQRAFKAGNINVLSSSTTFELGVDLGDLDTIFLRNVPPESFNYTQRVGRSGRRSGHPGFAVTYCRRSPHDLYHFISPQERILSGIVNPPVISLMNEKIIERHIIATLMSYYFKNNRTRFNNVESLINDFNNPDVVDSLLRYVKNNQDKLQDTLKKIVPSQMVDKMGLSDNTWIDLIDNDNSRFKLVEMEVVNDYILLKKIERESVENTDYKKAEWAKRRADTVSKEDTLTFLSRKAVIPKYGFPVDVVELDTNRIQSSMDASEVLLQRDLSLAISEFAPSSKIIANKREWTSYGLKKVVEKEWPTKFYMRCVHHNLFSVWTEGELDVPEKCCNSAIKGKYVIPQFGFVTERKKPDEPKIKSARVFTTKPYFLQLKDRAPEYIEYPYLRISKASPGIMAVICEGRRGSGFYICEKCGAGFRDREKEHKTYYGDTCRGRLSQFSLGHEFETDVIKMEFLPFPELGISNNIWFAYSLAYALSAGASEILEIPSEDINATVGYVKDAGIPPIILYDNVPGGAGLVARLENENVLKECLQNAMKRVDGTCGCAYEDSCYGCLRNFRNQFAHQHLSRGIVCEYFDCFLKQWKQ